MTMDSIVSVNGNNNYKKRHINKEMQRRAGTLAKNYTSTYRGPYADKVQKPVPMPMSFIFECEDEDETME